MRSRSVIINRSNTNRTIPMTTTNNYSCIGKISKVLTSNMFIFHGTMIITILNIIGTCSSSSRSRGRSRGGRDILTR